MAVSRDCQTDHGTQPTRNERTDDADADPGCWTRRATAAALVSLLGTGCLRRPSSDGDEPVASVETTDSVTETSSATTVDATETPVVDSPKVADVLVGLVRAEDRSAYAAANNLDYRDGRVRVVVELAPDTEPPTAVPLDVVARGSNAVEAYVHPSDIPRLAAVEHVQVIRPPRASAPSSQ